ncbi:2'-5' RNA ligase family protein [Nocardioides panaciterrulae]|uniref:2'-5' RNA ligase family protein n=1 Tax=Nocardioides panaciterrulae TaxID=661492 RepID=A0A7Y9E5Q3_9ACTN|nr:2'-5' RNA ligase family protein [Nocardioides panaciterrulae]NYD41698.1 hypothetical protein [Nocardioides panaciterrulae]
MVEGVHVSGPMHSLELLPDEEGRAVVRRDWQALRDAGLPSQLDHRGPTNAPHLTVLAAPAIDARAEAVAVEVLGPLLPLRVRAAGLVLLGARRVTVARVVDVEEPLLEAVVRVRAAVPDLPRQGWLPHVTLARRLERGDVQRAVDLLGHEDVVLTLTCLRHWDPTARTVTELARG